MPLPLPTALLRYALSFVEVDSTLVLRLCLVSREWKASLTQAHALLRCTVTFDATCDSWRLQEASFSLLQGVQHLRMRITYLTLPILRAQGDLAPQFRSLRNLRSLAMPNVNMEGIGDSALGQLSRLEELNLDGCCQKSITSAAFAGMPLLRSLDLSNTKLAGISNAAFTSLTALEELKLSQASQDWVTNAAFLHLSRLSLLSLGAATLTRVNGDCFSSLPQLRWLDISMPRGVTVASSAYAHLSGLTYLDVSCQTDASFNDSCLPHLTRLRSLSMMHCSGVSDKALKTLTNLQDLDIGYCHELPQDPLTLAGLPYLTNLSLSWSAQSEICDATFRHTTALKRLDISHVRQRGLTAELFSHLPHLRDLDMSFCWTIPCAAFLHLTALTRLAMIGCKQVTDSYLTKLQLLRDLDVSKCHQNSLTWAGVLRLPELQVLSMAGSSLRLGVKGHSTASERGVEVRCDF